MATSISLGHAVRRRRAGGRSDLVAPTDRFGAGMDVPESAKRRFGRSFLIEAWSDKAQVLLHHWSDGCRCCGGLHAHVTGKSCFGCPSLPVGHTGPLEVRRLASCGRSRPAAAGHEGTLGIDPQVTAMGRLTDKLAEQPLTRFRRARFEVTHWKPPGLGSRIAPQGTGSPALAARRRSKSRITISPNFRSTIP